MKTKYDLHIHSQYSDGELSPQEIFDLAIKNECFKISIADHNSINFYKNQDIKIPNNIKLYKGCEISPFCYRGKTHILAYNFNENDTDLNLMLREMQQEEKRKIFTTIKLLKKIYNLNISIKDFEKMYPLTTCYNMVHIANYLLKTKQAQTLNEAFKIINKIGKTQELKIPIEEILEVIIGARGIPVVAHPLFLPEKETTEIKKKLLSWKKHGLMGIEAYHSAQKEDFTKEMINFAKENEFLISCGSDFHGEVFSPTIDFAQCTKFDYYEPEHINLTTYIDNLKY